MNKAIFVDRDGVINRAAAEGEAESEYVLSWEQFEFLPGVAEALTILKGVGFRIIVITNQRCVAKGLITTSALESIHQRMCEALAKCGASIDGIYYCPHDKQPPCSCRKPSPGLIVAAANAHNIELSESWMIGDSFSDIEAAKNAGCKAVKIARNQIPNGDHVFGPSLLDAARRIVEIEEIMGGEIPDAELTW